MFLADWCYTETTSFVFFSYWVQIDQTRLKALRGDTQRKLDREKAATADMNSVNVPGANSFIHSKDAIFTQQSIHRRTSIPIHFSKISRQFKSLVLKSAKVTASASPNNDNPPLVVVGSANADIYVEIDRLPKEGETISAKTGQTLAGGKGANQAACGGKLEYPTYFLGQVGEDAHGKLVTEALKGGGVRLNYVNVVADAPTGHAVVMLQAGGENSIIIVGGSNMRGWPEPLGDEFLGVVRRGGIVLLQREIPDHVNIQVAKAARGAGVPVMLDAGGMDAPIPPELLKFVDILSPNETELARLTGMPTDTFEQIARAVDKCYETGVQQVLVKLGGKGSALFVKGEEPIKQTIISATKVVDTTGAGDTFTAAFAVATVEGLSRKECLRFAAAAASLCVQVKGAIPSMPDRKSVLHLLQSQ